MSDPIVDAEVALRKTMKDAPEPPKPALKNEGLDAARRAATKFTPTATNNVLAALQAGHQMPTAAALAGVDTSTLYAWIKQGAADLESEVESKFATFTMQVQQAIAVSEGRALKVVTDKMQGGPDAFRAATWFLERRHPENWGRKDKVEVTGDPSQPIVVQLTWPGGGPATDDKMLEIEGHEDDDVHDAVIVEPDAAAG